MIDGAQPADLTDRCALLVGAASRGIGAAAAMTLAARDERVGLSTRSNASLREVEEQARVTGAVAHVAAADVTDQHSADRAVGEVSAELGPVDVLVYATEPRVVEPFEDLSDMTGHGCTRSTRSVLFVSAAQCFPICASRVRPHRRCRIDCGREWQSAAKPLNASKHALLGLTRCLAPETQTRASP